ncbi:hypothetical protein EHS25_000677 [Saitozyma podzolica]|uniref:Uncharacterized protein n=1 Tax=Saitozyma podzolica TaxID=1890683 RepID=A0A427YX02_9TREE|nr:hypothetical protein EHS25_000677 [Saitozyma podzolica]
MDYSDSSSESGNDAIDRRSMVPSDIESESEDGAREASDTDDSAFAERFYGIEDLDRSISAHKLVLTPLDVETEVQDEQVPSPQMITFVTEDGGFCIRGTDDALRSYIAELDGYIARRRQVLQTLVNSLISRGLWFEAYGRPGQTRLSMCSADTPEAQESLQQIGESIRLRPQPTIEFILSSSPATGSNE